MSVSKPSAIAKLLGSPSVRIAPRPIPAGASALASLLATLHDAATYRLPSVVDQRSVGLFDAPVYRRPNEHEISVSTWVQYHDEKWVHVVAAWVEQHSPIFYVDSRPVDHVSDSDPMRRDWLGRRQLPAARLAEAMESRLNS